MRVKYGENVLLARKRFLKTKVAVGSDNIPHEELIGKSTVFIF